MTPTPHTPPGTDAGSNPSSSATGQPGDGTRDAAHELGEKAKTEGRAQVDRARGTAADSVDRLAEGVQAAAARLGENDVGHLSEYVGKLAEGMNRLSSNLREKNGEDMLQEVSRLARDNPALFVTGSIALGFGLGRFARASDPHSKAMTTAADNAWPDPTATADAAAAPSGAASGASATQPSAPAGTPGSGTPSNTRGGMH